MYSIYYNWNKILQKKGRSIRRLYYSQKKLEFKFENNKKYEIGAIIDSIIYGKQTNNQISSLYYIIL